MLVEFTFENFKSFKDKTTFSMEPVSHNGKPVNEIETNFKDVKSVFRTAAIFGPNASGKSNFIEALMFFKNIVVKSYANPINTNFELPIYILGAQKNPKTFFEIKFIINNFLYRYNFSLNDHTILTEEFYLTDKETNKEKYIFIRTEKNYEYNKDFIQNSYWLKETISTRLFLSELVNNRNINNDHIFNSFIYIGALLPTLNNINPDNFDALLNLKINDKENLLTFMNKADFNIKDVKIKNLIEFDLSDTSSPEIISTHQTEDGRDIDVGFYKFESEGTKIAFALSGKILPALHIGATFVIDELDRSLHPLLVKHIVNMFNNPETNPKNAQLIFTSHAHYLMDGETLSRDQIWLTSKENGFSSQLYSLGDFKELTRKKDNFYNEYMYGIFGAIPNIKED